MARWMEGGRSVSDGSMRSRAESTAMRSSSKKAGSFMEPEAGTRTGEVRSMRVVVRSSFVLFLRLERLGRQLAIGFLQQNFDAALGFLKLFLALAGKLHAFFEELHGFIQSKLGTLQ